MKQKFYAVRGMFIDTGYPPYDNKILYHNRSIAVPEEEIRKVLFKTKKNAEDLKTALSSSPHLINLEVVEVELEITIKEIK